MTPEAAKKLDTIAAKASDWFDVSEGVRASKSDFDPKELEALNAAFAYGFRIAPRVRHSGDTFTALFETTTGAWPPVPHETPEGWRVAWAAAFNACTDPCVRARLGDLLWSCKAKPNPRAYADGAIAAYLELDDRWESIIAMNCCSRAVQIACEIEDGAARKQALDRAIDRAVQYLNGLALPGQVFPYLQALFIPQRAQRPPEIAALLAQARAVYAGDPWNMRHVFDLEHELAAGNERQLIQIARDRAEVWAGAAANAENGLKRIAFLENAIEVARDIPDLRDRLIVERQKVKLEDLGLKRFEVGTTIDKAPFEHWTRHVLGGVDASDAVRRLIALKAPTGDASKVDARAEAAASVAPLARITAQSVVTSDGVTSRRIDTDEDHAASEVAQWQRMSAELSANMLLAPVLDEIPLRFPGDPATDIVAGFEIDRVADEGNALVRNALHAYWAGETTTCACVLVPLIEHAARRLAKLWEKPMLAQDARGYVALHETLEQLKGHIDESWRQYLVVVLVSNLGFNLRNQIAHGLTLHIPRISAALMILALLYLATVEGPKKTERDANVRKAE